jgi:hypothetical protein
VPRRKIPAQRWKVSVLAQTGLSFDLSTASGKPMRTTVAGLVERERDLIRDRGPSNWGVRLANAHRTRRPSAC